MNRIFYILICFILSMGIAFAENISTYKLPNGQTVVIKQVKNNPIVTIDTWIRTGSINEDDSNNGISHFLEHLFFKGTELHPTGEFDKILESKGAITNAATSKDFTHYYITVPSNYFEKALELHADMLLHPQIPRKEMEKERKVVLEEIAKDANLPTKICYENLVEMLYTTHPYKRKVIGTAKNIETVTRETILDYYKKYYSPSNMITIVVGDVDPDKALECVKQYFDSPVQKTVQNSNKKEKLLTSQKRNISYQQTQSGYMMIGFRSVDVDSSDVYALDVLSTILGGGKYSRLYQVIKEQKQLVNSISASNSTMKEDGIFLINTSFQPNNVQKAENAIFSEIDKIKMFGISESDIKIAKKRIETDTYYSRESISNIAQELGYVITLTGSTDFYNNYLDKINKVTVSDVKRVANKYLTTNNSAISIVLPKGVEQAQISNQEVKTSHSSKLVDNNSNTKKYILDTNATLLIQDNSYNDIVAISILAKGGNFYEQKRGTSKLFADLLLKGTKRYSTIELAKELEENGIEMSFAAHPDTFNINILTTKKQLSTTLALLDEILNNSTFDDSEIEKSKTLILNNIKQSKDKALNVALDEYRANIYGTSVYNSSLALIEKSIPSITKKDIIDYQSKILNPNNIVISVNGNVDKDVLVSAFGNIFTKKSESQFDYSKHSIPVLNSPVKKIKKLDNQQTAWIILGWQTDGVVNEKDYATLEVINTMLGSGMSSRLFKSVREQEGLAYQVGASFNPNVLSGAFIVYVGTNPNTIDRAKQKLVDEVVKLKTQFVSDKELKAAKDRLAGEFVIALETNKDKASTLGWFEASGRGFKFIDKYGQLINSVTVSDIIEVANKYFGNIYVESIVTTR